MQSDYYFHERIAIECQRLVDLRKELNDQFDDPDLPDSLQYNVELMSEHIHKAIMRLRFAEQYGVEKKI